MKKKVINSGLRGIFLSAVFFTLLFSAARAERLPIRVFTSSDGLGSSFVDNMMRDSRGFMWFGTRDGLSRFDGSQFITYQIGGENASPGIESIFESRDGTYWVGTTGGLYRFRAETLSKPQPANAHRQILNVEFVANLRGTLFEDGEGNLYISAGKIFQVKKTADREFEFPEFKLNLPAAFDKPFTFSEAKRAPDNSLWIKTNLGVLRRLPDERVIFYPYNRPVFESSVNIHFDEGNKIWLSVAGTLYIIKYPPIESLADYGLTTTLSMQPSKTIRLDAEKIEMPQNPNEIFEYDDDGYLDKHVTKSIYQTADKRIWLATGKEVVEFDGVRFQRYGAEDGILETRKMAEDVAGNLWISSGKGLMRLDRKGLRTYKESDGLISSSLYTVLEGSDGRIYTMQGDHLLGQLENKRFHTVSLKVKSNSRVLWASHGAIRTRDGYWWIASHEGVYKFPAVAEFKDLEGAEPLAFYDKNNVLKGTAGFELFEDSRGDIWISTRGDTSNEEGLTRLSRATGEFYTFSAAENYPEGKSPASFAEDKNGDLWISFYQGGIARYRDGKFIEFNEADGIPTALTSDLLIDRRGRLWVGSARGGLIRIDNLRAEKLELVFYNAANGLSSNNVRTITEDFFGNIYVGTVRGVDKLSPETGRVRYFSIADGLAGDFVVDSLCDRNGTIWFATMNGLSKLSPLPEENQIAPRAWISGLSIDGLRKPVEELGSPVIENIELAPSENNLQIDFFGLNFNPSETLRYQYKLEGADRDWSAATERRNVSYANLTPGAYRFLVRSVNADGVAGENPAIVSFVINPPFWRQSWFVALAMFGAAGLIFALDRYRVAKTRQVENALRLSRESEARFRTLAETASDAILTIDADSNIVFINPALEKIFGYTADEMIGKNLTILMPESFRPKHEAGLRRYLSTNHKNIAWTGVELPGMHKSGAQIPLEVSFGEFERDGKRYFTGIIRDISERRRAEEALRKSREERFRELERVRTRIATDLHDDIGSSLTQIAVLSEVARNQATSFQSDTLVQPLERIKIVSRELVEAMSDVVWAINPRKDNLRDLVQRMRRFASDVCSGRGIHFELDAMPIENGLQLGANIRREVFAIFKESINNAVKYSECKNVLADFRIEKDWLILQISDDGRGFDPEQILSEEFSPEKGGNGLVNMRRRAAELGGSCRLISFPGGGTTVLLEAPLHHSENGSAPPAHLGGDNGNGRVL